MSDERYLYINEEGRVGVSDVPPTVTDLHEIGDGCLQVFKISTAESFKTTLGCNTIDGINIEEVDEDGTLFAPGRAEIHNEEGDDFHVCL